MQTLSIEVTLPLSGRIDRAVRQLTARSLSEVRGLFDHDCVKLNGLPCPDPATLTKTGDAVTVHFDEHRRYHPRARAWEDSAFKIVFEDDHLIVVDKAAGVLTVPASPGDKDTLVQAVSRYFEVKGVRERAQLVQRLDRGVSGLIVLAKTRAVALKLQSQFEDHKPEREYAAIVHGAVPESGTFESYLATSKSFQRFSTQNQDEGELAITHYQFKRNAHSASWVRVWLETGRRNQIRVHFAEAGHPVLGDPRYKPELAVHPRWRAKRLALHAAVLGFVHPVTGKTLRFESPLPAPMKSFLGLDDKEAHAGTSKIKIKKKRKKK